MSHASHACRQICETVISQVQLFGYSEGSMIPASPPLNRCVNILIRDRTFRSWSFKQAKPLSLIRDAHYLLHLLPTYTRTSQRACYKLSLLIRDHITSFIRNMLRMFYQVRINDVYILVLDICVRICLFECTFRCVGRYSATGSSYHLPGLAATHAMHYLLQVVYNTNIIHFLPYLHTCGSIYLSEASNQILIIFS